MYLPELAAPVGAEVARFVELVATLRHECPWDRKQTHAVAAPAPARGEPTRCSRPSTSSTSTPAAGYDHLEEELGDLLFQVVFHARLAAEEGQFTLADVARGVHDKLVSRHPHVFGDVEVTGADDVRRQLGADQEGREGSRQRVRRHPGGLPALLFALKVQKKAATIELGVEDGDIGGAAVDPLTHRRARPASCCGTWSTGPAAWASTPRTPLREAASPTATTSALAEQGD